MGRTSERGNEEQCHRQQRQVMAMKMLLDPTPLQQLDNQRARCCYRDKASSVPKRSRCANVGEAWFGTATPCLTVGLRLVPSM
jgi:hypothetical protein